MRRMITRFFFLLILATPTFLFGQSYNNSNDKASRGASGFVFKPEVSTIRPVAEPSAGNIELSEFTAKVVNNVMELEWRMAAVSKNTRFIIERSLDGNSFDVVGEATAAGINNVQVGSFSDDGLLHAHTYYRLKQANAYSVTIKVDLTREKANQINIKPTSDKEVFTSELPFSAEAPDYRVTVYDQLGQLAEYTTETLVDQNLLLVDLDQQPAGLYVLVVEGGGKTYTNSFEKVN